jgi:hypothetical protein
MCGSWPLLGLVSEPLRRAPAGGITTKALGQRETGFDDLVPLRSKRRLGRSPWHRFQGRRPISLAGMPLSG